MAHHRRVLIRWKDATGGNRTGQWRPLAEMVEARPMVISSLGFLLSEDDERFVLVPSISDDGYGDGETVIPKDWVVDGPIGQADEPKTRKRK